jgi:putative ABC transport system ATP-binding protein
VIELVPHRPPEVESPVERTLEAGEVVFSQGDASDLIYVIESGGVDIERVDVDRGTHLLAHRGPEAVVGEMGPLFGLPRSATARATTDTTLTGYSPNDFRDALGVERLDGLVRQRPD